MNNFEKIKQMTVEEMAIWLGNEMGVSCTKCIYYDKEHCNCKAPQLCMEAMVEHFKHWLQSEE